MNWHAYLQLTKPGIIGSNLITLSAGFLLAAQGQVNVALWLLTALGTALVIASGAVCNNLIDQDIDALMLRTQQRPLVLGLVAPAPALLFAVGLGLSGFMLLAAYSSLVATLLAIAGWLVYVGLYSLYFKRHSIHGVAIGSLSGAAPPMIGYCAISHQIDAAVLCLGLILCLWQIPHAYAIALRRLDDYQAAKLRLLPLVKGVALTQRHMQRYILLFTVASTSLYWLGYAGIYYLITMIIAGAAWRWAARNTPPKTPPPRSELGHWGLTLFLYSIAIIMLFSLMLALDYVAADSRPMPMVHMVRLFY